MVETNKLMSGINHLIKYAEENKTILCFGIDPDLDRINKSSGINPTTEKDVSIKDIILNYYSQIIEVLLEENQIASLKPNYAYFAQYGFEGLKALQEIISNYKNKTFIILDAKRGDIGKSSKAYARELYDFWNADGITIHSYMGSDSVKPFLRDDKITYMMCRTSNEGARDFEEIFSKEGKQIYEYVAQKSVEWNCGLVVGATSDAIKKVIRITKGKIPLLIPGIGAQGGDLNMVLTSIKSNPYIHRINSSSSIAYACESRENINFVKSALNETKKLNESIRKIL